MKDTEVYERVSTTHKDQDEKLQESICLNFCKENNLNVVKITREKGSAYKGKRPEWEALVNRCKTLKRNIVVFRYDRCFRNREEFFKFIKQMFEEYCVKVYSASEPSILNLWNMIDRKYSDDPSINSFVKGMFRLIWDFVIKQAGEQAEEDSRKIGDRVKLAVRKTPGGLTKSYKGKKWGRRKEIPTKLIQEVLDKKKMGLSIREISQSVWYWDGSRNQKFISKSAVHKILKENA